MKTVAMCTALLAVGLLIQPTEAAISHTVFDASTAINSKMTESILIIDDHSGAGYGGPTVTGNCTMTFSPNAEGKDASGDGVIRIEDANIDIGNIFADNNIELINKATLINFELDNILAIQTESGSLASIKKKNAGDMTITVIPEPGTASLLGGGSLFLISFRRRLSGLRHHRRSRTCGSYTRMIINHLLGKSVL